MITREDHIGMPLPPSRSNGTTATPASKSEEMAASVSKVGNRAGSVKGLDGAEGGKPASDGAARPEITVLRGRSYRNGPVEGRMLPGGLVRSMGLVTHQGTAREEVGALAIFARLVEIAKASEDEAVQFADARGVHVAKREEGTVHKSYRSLVVDLRRRLYKVASRPPTLRERWPDDFETDYDRIRRAVQRAPYVHNEGSPIGVGGMTGCLAGRRFRVEDALHELPDAPPQRDSVRCTGPAPTMDRGALHRDVLDELERLTAHRENLHEAFTAGLKQTKNGGRYTTNEMKVDARRSEQWIAKKGSDRPQLMSVGRFRPEEIEDENLVGERALTEPWIVVDLDSADDDGERSKSLAYSHAERLLKLLRPRMKSGAFERTLVVDTGGSGVHVRIPAGALGNRLYPNKQAAPRKLSHLFDRLCEDDPDLWEAIDEKCFNPRQKTRMVGSVHPNGNRVVAMTAPDFLEVDPIVLRAHSEAGRFEPFTLPDPTKAPFCPSLNVLFESSGDRRHTHPSKGEGRGVVSTVGKPTSEGLYERALQVDEEGEKWGRDVDRPDLVGRNCAAFTISLVRCTYSSTPWREVCAWNRQMAEPLPQAELEKTFQSAKRYVT